MYIPTMAESTMDCSNLLDRYWGGDRGWRADLECGVCARCTGQEHRIDTGEALARVGIGGPHTTEASMPGSENEHLGRTLLHPRKRTGSEEELFYFNRTGEDLEAQLTHATAPALRFFRALI